MWSKPWRVHDITISECQVAAKIISVVRYLSKSRFTMWDVHREHVLMDYAGHVIFLDVFMGPCECFGPLSGRCNCIEVT